MFILLCSVQGCRYNRHPKVSLILFFSLHLSSNKCNLTCICPDDKLILSFPTIIVRMISLVSQNKVKNGFSVNFSEDVTSGNSSLTQSQRVRNPNPAAKSVKFAEVKEKTQTLPPSTSQVLQNFFIISNL